MDPNICQTCNKTDFRQEPQRRSSNRLNYDTLIHVFQFLKCDRSLGNAAQVCKAWRLAAYDPSLWRDSVANLANCCLSEEMAISLCHRKIKAVKLALEEPVKRTASTFKLLAQTVGIKVLMVSLVAEDIPTPLPKKFESLQSLSLTHTEKHTVTSQGLEAFLSPFVNLVQLHIDIEMGSLHRLKLPLSVHFNYLDCVLACLPNLRDLETAMINQWVGFNFSNINPPNGNNPNLERLLLHEVCTDVGTVVESISILFPNLKHLLVNQWNEDYLNEDSEFTHSLQHLQSLKANSAFYMLWIIRNLRHVCQTSKHLTALDISLQKVHHSGYAENDLDLPFLCHEDVELIFHTLPRIKMLNIFGHSLPLQTFNKVASHMKHLQVLVLSPQTLKIDTVGSEELFGNLKQHWSKLRSILGVNFYGCYEYLSNVCYITAGEGDEEDEWFQRVAKLEHRCDTNSTQLKLLNEFTSEWHVAIGTKFFQLPSSYTFEFAEPAGSF